MVPGSASGDMDGVAVKPLTVSFHEGEFLEQVNKENRLGFWFQLDTAQQENLGAGQSAGAQSVRLCAEQPADL